jgi:predicted porin
MWQLGAKYAGTGLPLELWGAYGNRKDQFGLTTFTGSTGTGSKDTAWQVGGAYTLGDIRIFANYEQLKYALDNAVGLEQYKRSAFGVGLKWNLASGYVGAQYIQAMKGKATPAGGSEVDANDTGARQIGLGYYHNMSKQTQVYILTGWLDNDDLANYCTAGIGNAASCVNVGATYWGLGVGIKHTF